MADLDVEKLDEKIDTLEFEEIDPADEEIAELVLNRGLNVLSWDDYINATLVCHSWRSVVNGQLTSRTELYSAFKKKYSDEEKWINFHRHRAKADDKAHEHCLLLVFEAQMLLRELAEYKKSPPPQAYQAIRDLLAKLNFDDSDEKDLLDKIAALRNELVKTFMRNAQVENQLKALEHKISLLIQHRASIHEIDRKKKKKKGVETENTRPTFYKDVKKMKHYSNLFYLIRTEPKYLARLAYLLPPNNAKKLEYADTVILTLYANAFSPLEEYLILELLNNAVQKEIQSVTTVDDFVSSDSATPMMIISYNKRKQGKQYVKNIFTAAISELIEQNEEFAASPTGGAPKLPKLTAKCEQFLKQILASIDTLPYGFRLICKNIHDLIQERFKDDKKQLSNIWRAVGYYVYYRFVGLAIVRPDDFGVVEKDEVTDSVAMNLIAISKVLKALFMLTTENSGPYVEMNEWILSKHESVLQYLKNVIDVPPAEEYLQVNKYGQLARKDKASIVIYMKQICQLHGMLEENMKEITEGADDPLNIILKDLGPAPKCPDDDETELQLDLENRFPPQLSKLDLKKNLKQETIDDAIKILKEIPGFSGDTFLEIFVRMKLHAKKNGEAELANRVNQVIANLQNLAKHGLVSPKDGFNSFLKDIHAELLSRQKRYAEQVKEVERLKTAIKELDNQKVFMQKKMEDFEAYLSSVRQNAGANFKSQTKKYKYKDLVKAKVIEFSEIPQGQQDKVKFEITHTAAETFNIKGKIKNLPGFSRDFDLELGSLLEARDDGKEVFDTEKGLELYVASTILFLNKNFYSGKK